MKRVNVDFLPGMASRRAAGDGGLSPSPRQSPPPAAGPLHCQRREPLSNSVFGSTSVPLVGIRLGVCPSSLRQ